MNTLMKRCKEELAAKEEEKWQGRKKIRKKKRSTNAMLNVFVKYLMANVKLLDLKNRPSLFKSQCGKQACCCESGQKHSMIQTVESKWKDKNKEESHSEEESSSESGFSDEKLTVKNPADVEEACFRFLCPPRSFDEVLGNCAVVWASNR